MLIAYGQGDPTKQGKPIPTSIALLSQGRISHCVTREFCQDFKQFKEQVEHVQGKLEHAIYNETTGRIVVRGEPSVLITFEALSITAADRLPKVVELDLEFLENDLLLFQTSLRANPGQKAVLKTGNGPHQISIDWEAEINVGNYYVEGRFKVDGNVRGRKFKLHTGLTIIDDVAHRIPLGAVGMEQPILKLNLTQRVLLPGDVTTTELVLDERGKPTTSPPPYRVVKKPALEEGLTDLKTGKILKGFRVLPIFIRFLSASGGSSGPHNDPFATGEETDGIPQEITYLTRWDPRIPARLSDRMVDCKQLLKNSGVELGDSDFAVLNLESNTLYVQGSRMSLEVVEGILGAGHAEPPKLIGTNLKLIESLEKLSLETLSSFNHKTLATVSTNSLPGQTAILELDKALLEIEATIGANDSLVESRCEFHLEGKNEISVKTGLVQKTGEPQIIQSTFQSGKWRSLIFTSTIKSPAEDIE